MRILLHPRPLAVTALAALTLAACVPPPPPPPPPPPAWCASAEPPPDANDHAAFVVDDDTGEAEVVEFEADTSTEVYQEVAELEEDGDVTAVDRVEPVQALVDPSDDPQYADQWGFAPAFADLATAWATPADGTGVRVAVIDTGVQGNHPDLDANVVAGKDFVVDDSASDFGRIDGHGHGTHVAGTIAAEDNAEGVVGGAPAATVVPVRVLNCLGAGSTADVAAGILWAIDDAGGDASVLNLSLGGSHDDVLEQAVNTALGSDVVVVAAAGNNGNGSNVPVYPASYPGVISVGAISDDPAGAVRFPDSADTPSTPASSFTTEPFDLVVRLRADDWTPPSEEAIASKYDAIGGTGYELTLDPAGTLTFSALGQAATSTNVTPLATDGSTIWVRVLRDGVTVSLSAAPDSSAVPTTWPTDLGTFPAVLPGDLTTNAGAFVIGDGQTPGRPFHGFVRFAALRTTPTTSPAAVVTFDATTPEIGVTSWVSTQTGETWTLHGDAVVAVARAPYSNTSSNVAVAAPGSGVVSTYSANGTCTNNPAPPAGYCFLSGTSMATPHVAAVAALLLQKCPGLLPADVTTWITSGPNAAYGFKPGVGLLRAPATLAAC